MLATGAGYAPARATPGLARRASTDPEKNSFRYLHSSVEPHRADVPGLERIFSRTAASPAIRDAIIFDQFRSESRSHMWCHGHRTGITLSRSGLHCIVSGQTEIGLISKPIQRMRLVPLHPSPRSNVVAARRKRCSNKFGVSSPNCDLAGKRVPQQDGNDELFWSTEG